MATSAPKVLIQTNFGNMTVEFFPDKAPNHVNNFLDLAKKGFYDGTAFHRVIPGFMIQGGCPNTKEGASGHPGTGGPGHHVDAEFNDIDHQRGILSMARAQDPNSAGSQFFVVVKHSPFLNGQYTVFGRVVDGIETADKIVELPRDANDMPSKRAEMKVTVLDE